MFKTKCSKHGVLEPSQIVKWCKELPGRWCGLCMNELMDACCGNLYLVEIKDDDKPQGEK